MTVNPPLAPEPAPRTRAHPGHVRAQEAADHADRVHSPFYWSINALEYTRIYAETHDRFLAEDVRAWSHEQGLPQPPSLRAWGAIMIHAARSGFIEKVGATMTKHMTSRSNNTYAVEWRSRINPNAEPRHVCPTCNRVLDTNGNAD